MSEYQREEKTAKRANSYIHEIWRYIGRYRDISRFGRDENAYKDVIRLQKSARDEENERQPTEDVITPGKPLKQEFRVGIMELSVMLMGVICRFPVFRVPDHVVLIAGVLVGSASLLSKIFVLISRFKLSNHEF